MVRWVSVVGARPQFIKLAPLCRAIEDHNQAGRTPVIQHRIIHTGQHYDREMAELFFVQLRIPEPEYNLGVGSGSHGVQIARMLERMEPVLLKERPDWVVVYGDTNSTLAGALLAARMFIPLAHVEAGCRSYNRRIPEEQNRVVTDHLSQLLLAPTQSTVENLWREGIGLSNDPLRRTVAFTGDIMYDALIANLKLAERRIDEILEDFGLEKDRFYLLTLHRAENTDGPERLRSILHALEALDLPVLFPVHPRTRKVLFAARIPLNNGNIRIVPPIGYLDMLALEKHARKILTDSGGVQKEAFYLKVPCVTLREETEWPETAELGANQTTGVDRNKILEAVRAPHPGFEQSASIFGAGDARQRILEELLSARTGSAEPSDR
jgi:UDP-GlcNAc3NAcA epimerase